MTHSTQAFPCSSQPRNHGQPIMGMELRDHAAERFVAKLIEEGMTGQQLDAIIRLSYSAADMMGSIRKE